jgi:GNAT superfamily N-acetyltransferase
LDRPGSTAATCAFQIDGRVLGFVRWHPALTVETISIKPVESDDFEAAIALFDAQLREHDIITSTDDLYDVVRAVTDNPSLGFLLLAMTEDTPTGVAYAASHLSLEHGGMIGWLEELYVLPQRRGCGIGSRLLTEVIARARELNWRGIELEVVAGHERAVPLYIRHNFQPLSRSRFCRIFSNDHNTYSSEAANRWRM